MAEDPRHPWGSGATTYLWRPSVRRVVQLAEQNFPLAAANSYVCHPWCGWATSSVDWWGPGGRGDPLPETTGLRLRSFLMQLAGAPYIRHTIFQNQIWTSWGGYSRWTAEDHDGPLQHLHVTYWK